METTGVLRAVKTAGAFLTVGAALCLVGWFLSPIVPLVAFLLWLFGVPVAILALPIGVVVWLGNRKTAAANR